LLAVFDRQVDAEALEVDHDKENEDSRHDVRYVWKVLSVESLFECTPFVLPRQDEMKQSDQRALKLGTATSVDGCRRERLPDDRLADVCCNEKGDP